jgi:hypothetical protein
MWESLLSAAVFANLLEAKISILSAIFWSAFGVHPPCYRRCYRNVVTLTASSLVALSAVLARRQGNGRISAHI